ncbi:uncharacterized protein [Watersipora subatra]|uniref:uncharacterized protein isoform X3 n=1 Tax=Watersipora subatra TaxID=2589382 RepID=UPI00355BD0B1
MNFRKQETSLLMNFGVFAGGMLAVSLATMCYECDSLDSSCNDGDTGYVVSSSHETNCSQSIWSLDKNGGCSKYKTRTKTFGIWIESVDRTCGQKYYKTNCKEADKRHDSANKVICWQGEDYCSKKGGNYGCNGRGRF